MDIEQRRRDLKRDDPKLYAYIAHREVAAMCDALGDYFGPNNTDAANTAWQYAGEHKRIAEGIRDE